MQSDSMSTYNQYGAADTTAPATGSSNINVGPTERIASAVIGGALTAFGIKNLRSFSGIAYAVAGGMLLQRGLTGYCAINRAMGRNSNSTIKKTNAMEINETFMINKPRYEVYSFWRKLENLPRFMKHLDKVVEEDNVNSKWTAKLPGNFGSVSWKATILEDQPQELISWSSKPGSTIDTAGEVRFKDAMNGMGTELQVIMSYRLPAGEVGSVAGKLFNPKVEKMVNEDIRRFKQIIESGADDLDMPSMASTGSLSSFETSTVTPTSLEDSSLSPSRKGRGSRKKPDATTTGSASSGTQSSGLPDQDIKTYEDNFMERD